MIRYFLLLRKIDIIHIHGFSKRNALLIAFGFLSRKKISPKNQITIKGEFDTKENITIYNLLGQKVIERNSISNEERIDVSKLESGVYTIYFNTTKASYKFIKE